MSGTSADGVSLALCCFERNRCAVRHYATYPYPEKLRQSVLNAGTKKTAEISRLHMTLGYFYTACVTRFIKQFRVKTAGIEVIGSHGQTIYHGPQDSPPNTFQIGEASVIAEKTGIPVVSDFRMRDIAAGGEGAPLIPFFDQFFWGKEKPRALQNIGGIANVAVVGKGMNPIAFDTGPGNCLIDWAVQTATRGKQTYDRGGHIARSGSIDQKAIREMIRHPYFRKRPPKSTGRELFNSGFIPVRLKKKPLRDQIATLTFFTAFSIYESCRQWLPLRKLHEVIASGGGAFNLTLMHHLGKLFYPIPVRSIAEYGMHPQAKEPAAFALFAHLAINRKINHAPRVTGAKHARILGKITY